MFLLVTKPDGAVALRPQHLPDIGMLEDVTEASRGVGGVVLIPNDVARIGLGPWQTLGGTCCTVSKLLRSTKKSSTATRAMALVAWVLSTPLLIHASLTERRREHMVLDTSCVGEASSAYAGS